jgi:hypothetical protein
MKAVNVALGLAVSLAAVSAAQASVDLVAIGSISGTYQDLSTRTAAPLENGIAGNKLGGLGSGIAYAGGNTFLALPDRGPNAVPFNSAIDDTASYIPRFQTFNLNLAPNEAFDATQATSLPLVLTPTLRNTTLLSSLTPLVYGSGAGLGNIGSGAPALNTRHTFYFSGRSDNFDPSKLSTNPNDARLDPESIRVSNDGFSVFISDEYGPYVYQFDRATGHRTRAFKLPDELAVKVLSPVGSSEIAGNEVGRVANKGMEGLALTPDGRTLVGAMQAPLEQDTNNVIRLVSIDVHSGAVHEYAYQLTTGTGVSDIVAVNNQQFLIDERDGKGLGDGSKAKAKQLFLVNLAGAIDISGKAGDLSAAAVKKTLFLDIIAQLGAKGIAPDQVPAKIEGTAFGPDVKVGGATRHTLYVSNDNDFLATSEGVDNPNKFFVFAFDAQDLPGFEPQPVHEQEFLECGFDFEIF